MSDEEEKQKVLALFPLRPLKGKQCGSSVDNLLLLFAFNRPRVVLFSRNLRLKWLLWSLLKGDENSLSCASARSQSILRDSIKIRGEFISMWAELLVGAFRSELRDSWRSFYEVKMVHWNAFIAQKMFLNFIHQLFQALTCALSILKTSNSRLRSIRDHVIAIPPYIIEHEARRKRRNIPKRSEMEIRLPPEWV